MITAFNAVKARIGQLHKLGLSKHETDAVLSAWDNWVLVDRIARQRARLILQNGLGKKAEGVVEMMKKFDGG